MIGLWWVSWHLAINKIFQITSFNPLTSEILTRTSKAGLLVYELQAAELEYVDR